jgi:hypothetical protein
MKQVAKKQFVVRRLAEVLLKKLTGKDTEIKMLLNKKVSKSAVARIAEKVGELKGSDEYSRTKIALSVFMDSHNHKNCHTFSIIPMLRNDSLLML